MIIKDLKKIIEDLPDDADIVMQKVLEERKMVVAPILSYRVTKLKDGHYRLVLKNDKVPRGETT